MLRHCDLCALQACFGRSSSSSLGSSLGNSAWQAAIELQGYLGSIAEFDCKKAISRDPEVAMFLAPIMNPITIAEAAAEAAAGRAGEYSRLRRQQELSRQLLQPLQQQPPWEQQQQQHANGGHVMDAHGQPQQQQQQQQQPHFGFGYIPGSAAAAAGGGPAAPGVGIPISLQQQQQHGQAAPSPQQQQQQQSQAASSPQQQQQQGQAASSPQQQQQQSQAASSPQQQQQQGQAASSPQQQQQQPVMLRGQTLQRIAPPTRQQLTDLRHNPDAFDYTYEAMQAAASNLPTAALQELAADNGNASRALLADLPASGGPPVHYQMFKVGGGWFEL
jgi:hypothetical protein